MKFAAGRDLVLMAGWLVVGLISTGCSANRQILDSAANRTSTPAEANTAAGPAASASSLEADLQSLRDADFNFVYVFRRHDAAALEGDDKRMLGSAIPAEMNRRLLSDGGRAVIIGSNFRMPEDSLDLLKAHFAFEDLSKSELRSEPQPERPARR